VKHSILLKQSHAHSAARESHAAATRSRRMLITRSPRTTASNTRRAALRRNGRTSYHCGAMKRSSAKKCE